MAVFDGWDNFYVIVGSSAGALIGLQFVVITLIAGKPVEKGDEKAGRAFATPSVVHFVVVLLLAAVAGAPWEDVTPVAVLWGMVGLFGVLYAVVVAGRMRAQKAYTPLLEDWLFHAVLPVAAYALVAVSAFEAFSEPRFALFLVAAALLMLLFSGIHNAWDAVTYQVFVRLRRAG